MGDWFEARIKRGRQPSDLYVHLNEDPQPERAHHFSDEPWWPGAFVVRVKGVDRDRILACDAVDHVVSWDATPDEDKYATAWPQMEAFFQCCSALAYAEEDWSLMMVHCLLNARGLGPKEEARFGCRLWWNRTKMRAKWRLYARRRHERHHRATGAMA